MNDLISRSALMEALEKPKQCMDYGNDWWSKSEVKAIIDNAPTVEAKPVVRGEWKRTGSGSLYDKYECTNCHRPPKWDCLGDNHWRIAFTNICPNCGARMVKDNE